MGYVNGGIMKKIIKITPEESENIRNLHYTYTTYMNILQFLMNNGIQNNTTYDKKWDEAVQIGIKLEFAKKEIEKKYKPTGNWDRFEFDFDNYQVVFTSEDT